MSVGFKAPNCDKEISFFGFSGIIADAMDLRLRIRGHGDNLQLRKQCFQFHMLYTFRHP